MASIDWKGGKFKSAQQTKAVLRHNDRELRENHEHTNEKIQKKFTHFNENLFGGSYEQRAKKYGKRLSELVVQDRSGKTTPIIGQGLTVPVPPELMDEFYKHATTDFYLQPGSSEADAFKAIEKIEQWSKDVTDLVCEFVGVENFISSDLHLDELHKYYDPEKKSYVNSFAHIHMVCVPENPKKPGRMSGSEFASRARIIELNNRVEEMTQRDYGITWNTGEKKKRGKTVEQLKNASEREEIIAKAEAEAENIIRQAKADAERIKSEGKAEAQRYLSEAQNRVLSDFNEKKDELLKERAKIEKYRSEAQNRVLSDFNEKLEERFEKIAQESIAAAGIHDVAESTRLAMRAKEEFEKRYDKNWIPAEAEEDNFIP